MSHAQALAMKRKAHIVIDECVTGSYHRNSLEGLAVGCVVINGMGLLPALLEIFRQCTGGASLSPFVHASLDTLETVLAMLVERGAEALVIGGAVWILAVATSRSWTMGIRANWKPEDIVGGNSSCPPRRLAVTCSRRDRSRPRDEARDEPPLAGWSSRIRAMVLIAPLPS